MSALPGERFVGAMRVGLQYVRQSSRMNAILLRVALFFLQSMALIGLLPLVARELHGGGAGTYTLLLASMGAGAIVAALFLPRLRANVSRDDLVVWGTVLQAAAMLVVSFARYWKQRAARFGTVAAFWPLAEPYESLGEPSRVAQSCQSLCFWSAGQARIFGVMSSLEQTL